MKTSANKQSSQPIGVCHAQIVPGTQSSAIASCIALPSASMQSIGVCHAQIVPGTNEVQMFPAGAFKAKSDPRPLDAPHWVMNAALAQVVINQVAALSTPLVIDYEHQTLRAKENGQPAPAAGRFSKLEWREGDGLYAVDVKWTDKAAQMIADGEYLYNSPVFPYRKGTGEVTGLLMSALTNNPGIDGMSEILAAATADFINPNNTESEMDEEQLKLLGLKKGATPEEITAALTTQAKKASDAETSVATLTAQVKSLEAGGEPDPAKFVPIAALSALQDQLTTLQGTVDGDKVEVVVTAALTDGRLLPAMEDWARDLGKKDFAALTGYLDKAAPIAALNGKQTDGKKFNDDGTAALTSEDNDMCTLLGIDKADYQKTLQEAS